MAGIMMVPTATTVATDEPEIAANIAHASTAARPRPPYRWPTIVEAKWIIRLAAPPLVRKLPARMKNGIAMIGKLLSPSNSFNPTLAIGTSLRKKKKLMTVRPSAIEIGMPVSISTTSSEKMMSALI